MSTPHVRMASSSVRRSGAGGRAGPEGPLAPRPGAPATRTRDFGRTTLKRRHREVVRAFAEALFADDAPPSAARLDALVDEIDRFISPASKTLRFGLLAMLDAVRVLPLVLLRRLATFEELPLAARTAMLERMEGARLAPLCLVFVAFKTLMTIAYYEHPGELESIGYPGPARVRHLHVAEGAR